MQRVQKQLIDQTLEFWQARSPKTLTREDAREMIENVAGFFSFFRSGNSPISSLLQIKTHLKKKHNLFQKVITSKYADSS